MYTVYTHQSIPVKQVIQVSFYQAFVMATNQVLVQGKVRDETVADQFDRLNQKQQEDMKNYKRTLMEPAQTLMLDLKLLFVFLGTDFFSFEIRSSSLYNLFIVLPPLVDRQYLRNIKNK